jgi:hypothetical protein
MRSILIIVFLFPVLVWSQQLVSEEIDTFVSDTGQKVSSDTVEIIGYSSFESQANPDSVKVKSKTIKSILDSKSFSIVVVSRGCFHHNKCRYDFIKLHKTYSVFYQQYDSFDTLKVIYKESRTMKEWEHKAFGPFMMKGASLFETLYCTTYNWFYIEDNRKNRISFMDDRCNDAEDFLKRLGEISGIAAK